MDLVLNSTYQSLVGHVQSILIRESDHEFLIDDETKNRMWVIFNLYRI